MKKKEHILNLRLQEEDLANLAAIKKYGNCATSSRAIREAVKHYACYVSKKDCELEVNKYVAQTANKFAKEKGLWEEWLNVVCGQNKQETLEKFNEWKEEALKASKTENEEETK